MNLRSEWNSYLSWISTLESENRSVKIKFEALQKSNDQVSEDLSEVSNQRNGLTSEIDEMWNHMDSIVAEKNMASKMGETAMQRYNEVKAQLNTV